MLQRTIMTLRRYSSSDFVLLIVLWGLYLLNCFAASSPRLLQNRYLRSSGDDLPDCSKCIENFGGIVFFGNAVPVTGGVAASLSGIPLVGTVGVAASLSGIPLVGTVIPTGWTEAMQNIINPADFANLRKSESVCSVGKGYITASIGISLIKSDEYQMLFQNKVALPYKACVDSFNKIFDSIWKQVQAFDASSGTDFLLIDKPTLNDLTRFRLNIVEVKDAANMMKKTVGGEVEKWNNALSESGKKISKLKSDKVKYTTKTKIAKKNLEQAKVSLSKAQRASDDAYDVVNNQRDYDYEPSEGCIALMIIFPPSGAICMGVEADNKAKENAKKVNEKLEILHNSRDSVDKKRTDLYLVEKLLQDTEYDLCSTEVVAAFEERQHDSMKDNARLVSLIVPEMNKAVEYLRLNVEKGTVLTTSLNQTEGYIVELENVFTTLKSIGEHINQLKVAAKLDFSLNLSKEQFAKIQSVLKQLVDKQLKSAKKI